MWYEGTREERRGEKRREGMKQQHLWRQNATKFKFEFLRTTPTTQLIHLHKRTSNNDYSNVRGGDSNIGGNQKEL